jgi:putative phosphoribosyl transferase
MYPYSIRAARFSDRREAGRVLSTRLAAYAGRSDVVVLALPRGGVPVAAEVAAALGAPLDVFVVRKLGVPYQPELAMGAIASGGVRVVNDEVIAAARITPVMLESVTRVEQRELERRELAYRNGRPAVPLKDKVAILVDDGLATGSTMRAAVEAVRRLQPSRVVVAVPVGAPETCRGLALMADDVICVEMPVPFSAVGLWYEDFSQTTDDEVRALLDAAARAPAGPRR